MFPLNNRLQILSGSHLKLLALLFMTIDHSAAFLLPAKEASIWFIWGNHQISSYILLRCIGRLAFPIFAFLIVEGFQHTRNRWKYGRNLFIFACISEIPWNLVNTNTFFYPVQNVFFTLLIGYVGLCAIETYQKDRIKQTGALVILLGISILLRPDYGCSGFGFILLLYALYHNKLLKAIIGSCILTSKWIAGLAFIPIGMYNGQRGFIQSNTSKYLFYLYYPLHLICIYLIRIWCNH